MENQSSQSASVDLSSDSAPCCSQDSSQNFATTCGSNDSDDENCKHCSGGKHHCRHNPLITVGIAAATGFVLGWLLKGKK
jgi:hypothetical protein